MRESGYYPAGAEFDPNAPYNKSLDVESVTVDLTLTVRKTINVDMPKGYEEEDLHFLVSDVIKEITLTDKRKDEYEINDFKIEDYY